MRNNKWFFGVALIGILGWTIAFPHPALAAFGSAPWETALGTVVDLLTGSTGRLVAIIAVAGIGFMMLSGRMSVMSALTVIVGIAIIFGSANIVDMFH